eukprot:GHVP01052729.1.p1 GENE.GHVP01052729.1~~GHVP01052729.1.p1  ORF type:complete len:170 (+),score=20.52 GHVP01052729.1:558-1067(+)
MPIGYFFPRTPRLIIGCIFVLFLFILVRTGISDKIDGYFNIPSTNNDLSDLTISSFHEFLKASFVLLMFELIMEYGGIWLIYFVMTMKSVDVLESSHLEEKNKCLSVWLFLPILTFLGIFLFSWILSSWIPFYYIGIILELIHEKIYNPPSEFQAFFSEFSDPKSKSGK